MAEFRMSGTVLPQAPPAPGASARTGKLLSKHRRGRRAGAPAGTGRRGGSASQRNGPRGLRIHSAPLRSTIPRESLQAAGGSAAETGSGTISGRGSHLAVRQQERSHGILSSVAAYSGAGRDLAMEPHSSVGPLQLRFSPYAFNGGTVLAIAGEDFSIVASDTRLSEGFSIHTRDSPKCYKLTDKTVIGCSGFHGDCLTLTKIIEARLKMYKHSNNKAMTTGAVAAMLSTILYSRRFFPYYVYNIIGGLDEEGKGAVYSFDPVGSYQRDSFKAGGSASAMLQPLLDNQVGFKNMQNVEHVPLSLDRAMRLVKDVFISAAERDVYTGDALKVCIVTKEGIREETVPLRKD
nr:PREDICTED: proteasome subunit beta type-1 [Bos mutus]